MRHGFAKENTWKRIFNTNGELLPNRTGKQVIPSKTVNWLFNNIYCYLFIACFDWKSGVFQQTVVRVHYTLNKYIGVKTFSICFRVTHSSRYIG